MYVVLLGGRLPINSIFIVLIVAPRGMDMERRLQTLNDVEPTIQFSFENEKEGRLPFLDTVIIKDGSKAK